MNPLGKKGLSFPAGLLDRKETNDARKEEGKGASNKKCVVVSVVHIHTAEYRP